MQSLLEFDQHLFGELFLNFFQRPHCIDDHIRFATALVDLASNKADLFRFYLFTKPGKLFRPHDAANDSGRIFEVKVHILLVSVSTGLFRLSFLDGRDHSAQDYFFVLTRFHKLLRFVRRKLFDYGRHFRQRV